MLEQSDKLPEGFSTVSDDIKRRVDQALSDDGGNDRGFAEIQIVGDPLALRIADTTFTEVNRCLCLANGACGGEQLELPEGTFVSVFDAESSPALYLAHEG